MTAEDIKSVVEAMLMAAEEPLSVDRMLKLLDEKTGDGLTRDQLRETLERLRADYDDRGVELCEVASGYHFARVRSSQR